MKKTASTRIKIYDVYPKRSVYCLRRGIAIALNYKQKNWKDLVKHVVKDNAGKARPPRLLVFKVIDKKNLNIDIYYWQGKAYRALNV